jgi:hypothetical protein
MTNCQHCRRTLGRTLVFVLRFAGLASAIDVVDAQTPPANAILYACYVPATGTVYRIKETNTPAACDSKKAHVEFNWTDGVNAVRMSDPASGDVTGTFGRHTSRRHAERVLEKLGVHARTEVGTKLLA